MPTGCATVVTKTALILKDCIVCIIGRDIYSAVRALSIYPPPMHNRSNVGGGLCVYLAYHIFQQAAPVYVINVSMSIAPAI